MTHKRNAEREEMRKHVNADVELDLSGVTEPEPEETEESEESDNVFSYPPGEYRNMFGREVLMIPLKPWLMIPCSDCRQPATHECYEVEEKGAPFFWCGVCEIG